MGCFLACFEASGNEVEEGVRRLLARVLFFRLPRCNGEFLFSFLALADGAFEPEAWVGNGVPTLATMESCGFAAIAVGCLSWSFFNLQFLLGGRGPYLAVISNTWRDDGDGLWRRGIALEEFGVDGSIGPAGAETLGAGSIGGPAVMRGILGE